MGLSKKVLCFILSLLIIIVPVGETYAQSYTMVVPKYPQEKSKWCWAACAQMVGVYYGKTYSQSSICIHVKGEIINQLADVNEVSKAIRYTLNRVTQAGVASSAAFLIEAQAKRPAVLRIGWASTNYKSGHVYVVYGASEALGSVEAGLYLIDPISGVANKFYPYLSLVNGTTLDSGTGKYTHTWWTF